MLGGLHHGMPRIKAVAFVLVDLGHQDHRVTHNDAHQRQNPQDRHKAHRRAGRHQRQHHANQPQWRDTHHQEHLVHALQLDHQEGGHQEQHQRHHLGNRALGFGALLYRAAGLHVVAFRQIGRELVDVGLEHLDQISRLHRAAYRGLERQRGNPVTAPDQRLLQLVAHRGKGQ